MTILMQGDEHLHNNKLEHSWELDCLKEEKGKWALGNLKEKFIRMSWDEWLSMGSIYILWSSLSAIGSSTNKEMK